jgi:hypothetical protein
MEFLLLLVLFILFPRFVGTVIFIACLLVFVVPVVMFLGLALGWL